MIDFMKYLEDTFGVDNPIFISDIHYNNLSKENIRQKLCRLEHYHQIKRYERGIYYIPTQSIFGESALDFEDVMEKKYISNNNEVFGYFSGLYFENVIGLTTQMPNVLTITSNKTASKKRIIELHGRKLILYKSRLDINNENVKALQFFELFENIPLYTVNKYKYEILIPYIHKTHLTREMVIEYLPYFSNHAMNMMIRSGLIYEFI
ncbi:MAG: hypothetical protein LUH02_09420 [Erysipelotrichaceae bacterium]|nr:hypothetical protein [Erysipelotrichaceae bacterium]